MSTDDTIEPGDDEHPDLAAIESETNIGVVKGAYRSLFKFTGKLLGENKRRKDRVRELESKLSADPEEARMRERVAAHNAKVRELAAKPESDLTAQERGFLEASRRLFDNGLATDSDAYKSELAKLAEEQSNATAAEARREAQARRDALTADYRETRRKHEAQRLVAPLAHPDYAGLLADHVQDRIGVEEGEDGKPITTYKGKDGRPCSRDDLVAELRAEPAFSRIIVGASPQERAMHAQRVRETLGLPPPAKH